MAELLAEMRRSQQPLREAAGRLLRAGARGVLLPLAGEDIQMYALVGTMPEVESTFLSGEATLTALEEGKAFAGTEPCLIRDLHEALDVTGGAAGLSLPLKDTAPPVFFIAGELASVEVLASTLKAESD